MRTFASVHSGSCRATTSTRGEVAPKAIQAFGAAKQRRENRQVDQHNIAGARPTWRHPEECIEFAVAGFRERVRDATYRSAVAPGRE